MVTQWSMQEIIPVTAIAKYNGTVSADVSMSQTELSGITYLSVMIQQCSVAYYKLYCIVKNKNKL
jgi:hypothetical protein